MPGRHPRPSYCLITQIAQKSSQKSPLSTLVFVGVGGVPDVGCVLGRLPLPASGSPEYEPIGERYLRYDLSRYEYFPPTVELRERAFAQTGPAPRAASATAARISVMRSLLRNLIIGISAPSYTET